MSYLDSDEELTNNYLANHWHGRHSLPRSYWLNGTLIVGAVTLLPLFAVGALEADGSSLQLIAALALTAIVIALGAWLWGIVGIWRSAGHHEERGGVALWGKLARIAVVIGAIGLAGQAADLTRQSAELGQLALGRDSLGEPAVIQLSQGDTLELKGVITQGTAERFADALQLAPNVRMVILNSVGGRLLEAERIGNLIKARRLETVVQGECSSACIMPLLAGVKRTAAHGAQVGLHQPSFPGVTGEEHAAGVAATKQFYLEAGVRADFVDRAMAATPDDMWFPGEDELISAGVLTGIGLDRVRADNVASAEELNRKAPTRLDDATVMTKAVAEGMTLTFHHQVFASAEDFEPQWLRTELPRQTSKSVCSDKGMREMVAAGAVYRYAYVDEAGAPLTQFSIERC